MQPLFMSLQTVCLIHHCSVPLVSNTGKAKAEMVEFALTKDGSCLGAAVLAAAAARERTSSQSALAVA